MYRKLSDEERLKSHRESVKRWKEKNYDKQRSYEKKYYKTEAGKAKKAEYNRRYIEKMKLKKMEETKEKIDEYDEFDEYDAYEDNKLEEEYRKEN